MDPTRYPASAEEWLQWFEVYQAAPCRAHLCAAFGLDPYEAEVQINTARLRVFLYWDTIQAPLAYFRTTLTHEVWKHLRTLAHERQGLEAYASQQQCHARTAARTAIQVASVLEHATPAQRQLLEWFVQGDDDHLVAQRLGTTPHAIRQARHEAYVTLRTAAASTLAKKFSS